jgi:hypothetical protein
MTLPECFTSCKDSQRIFSKWKSPPAKCSSAGWKKFSAYKWPYNYTSKFLLCLSAWKKWPATITYPSSSDTSSGEGQCQTLADLLCLYSNTCNNCPRLRNNMLCCSTLHKEEGDNQRQLEGRRRSSLKPQGDVIPKIKGLGWWGGSWGESHSLGMFPTHGLYLQQRMMERWWT